jgi:hypothetical protein
MKRWLNGPAGIGSALALRIGGTDVRYQCQEELESGSVGGSGFELDAS